MSIIITADLLGAIFVGVALIGQLAESSELKSTRALRTCTELMLAWLLIDAGSYLMNGPAYPQAFLWILNLLAYMMGGLVFIAFIRYCRAYLADKCEMKRWVLMLPIIITAFNEAVNLVLYVMQRLVVFRDGYGVVIGGIPAFAQLLNMLLLVYLPVMAFTKRRVIGAKAVSVLGGYGIAPLIAIVIVLRTGIDLTAALGAVAEVTVVVLLQKDEVQRHIRQMNARLEETTAEQEAQLEEIGALNTELEETAAEREAQLEEIAELNAQLKEKQHYTDTLYHKLMKVQSCGIVAYRVPSHEVLIMNDEARRMDRLPTKGEVDVETLRRHLERTRYDNEEETRLRLRSIREPGDQYSFTFWPDSGDGAERHVYVTTQLVEMDNGELVVVSSLLDITELTELERSTAKANAANSAKTSFLFNMSHDIRTPMNAIIGYTGLMEKNLGDEDRLKDYLQKIRSSSDFLLSLINNVLEMARIESGKAVLDEEILSTGVVTDEVKSVYEELMRLKGIRFTQTTDIRTPYIFGDRVKLNEIFLNLVSNAYKYTPDGGSVTIDMRELPCEKAGWTILQTTVADSGIGMSAEYLPVLFEEFSRERTATDSRIQGTGLGMPIVKQLIDLMGGTIAVESTLGKGSTFTVTLPHRIAEAPEEYSEQVAEIDTAMFAGKRILLAEDNDLNAEIAMELLADAGLTVERAEDGIICVDMLSKAEAGYYDVVLMDIQMPNMNGYKATEKIRRLADSEKATIPIIAMTANAFEEDKRNALAVGMNGHLAKPINVSELFGMLGGILKVQGEITAARKKGGEELPTHVRKIILDMQCSRTVAALPGGLFAYEAVQPERLIYANRMACELWGCESFAELSAFAGGTFKGLVHPDDYERTEAEIWHQIDSGSNDLDRVRYRILRKDGSAGSVCDFGRLVRDEENGDIFYAFVAEGGMLG